MYVPNPHPEYDGVITHTGDDVSHYRIHARKQAA